jgi:mannose-6-phosphate isomerase-like protein (cupin superfamily)
MANKFYQMHSIITSHREKTNKKSPPKSILRSINYTFSYDISIYGGHKMSERIGQSEIIDITKIVNQCPEKWFNTTLSQVNDSLVRLGIFEGEFKWHHHDKEDEFFYVISGKLLLDLPEGTIELIQNQGYTVPKRTEHRTRAQEKTIVLMVETDTVKPKGE